MTDAIEQKAISFWKGPQFQGLLVRACGASGWIGTGTLKVCHYLGMPVPDPGTEAVLLSAAVTGFTEWVYGWYRDHPDNLIARGIRAINGGAVSQQAQTAIAIAATSSPSKGS